MRGARLWLTGVKHGPDQRPTKVSGAAVKRFADLVVSITLFTVLLPLMMVLALAITLQSPGPTSRGRREGIRDAEVPQDAS